MKQGEKDKGIKVKGENVKERKKEWKGDGARGVMARKEMNKGEGHVIDDEKKEESSHMFFMYTCYTK